MALWQNAPQGGRDMKEKVNIGIVGTGMISKVIAEAIGRSSGTVLAGIAGRNLNRSAAFARAHGQEVRVFASWQDMLVSKEIQAIYIATPTSTKEEIAVAALRADKHVLVDKPLPSLAATQRIIEAANISGAVLMDATHFVHHPRTAAIKAAIREIGPVTGIRSAFYFPFTDRGNIRFNRQAEPTGGLGDLAWYNMRATVEFLENATEAKSVSASLIHDSETGAVVRGAGMVAFTEGTTSTWDIGYTAGTVAMDLDIIGTSGIISLDDFVLDWGNSFAFQNADIRASYQLRRGTLPRPFVEKIDVHTAVSAHVLMVDDFATTIQSGHESELRRVKIRKLEQTQALLDALWREANVKT